MLNNLGISFQNIGNFNEAKKYFESLIKIDPKNTRSYRLLGMLYKHDISSIHLKKMEKMIKDQSLSDPQKTELYFALGKAYEDMKDYKKSFESCLLGNKLKRKAIKYNINEDVRLFANIKKYFLVLALFWGIFLK